MLPGSTCVSGFATPVVKCGTADGFANVRFKLLTVYPVDSTHGHATACDLIMKAALLSMAMMIQFIPVIVVSTHCAWVMLHPGSYPQPSTARRRECCILPVSQIASDICFAKVATE